MAGAYKFLLEGSSGELVEKKSRFIATIRPVESEEEAVEFIDEMKKKYYDARHNCYAFVIGPNAELTRCNDDGEPSGTAGRPMLELLLGEEIRNIAVVVTRYFGGTLLGTGGLVRAYTKALKEGLANCKFGSNQPGILMEAVLDYNGIGRLQHILGTYGIPEESAQYTDKAVFTFMVPLEEVDGLEKEIIQATCGKAKIRRIKQCYFMR